MRVIVVATTPALRPVVEQLRAAGREVTVVDTTDAAVTRVGVHQLTAVVVGDGPQSVEPFGALPGRLRRRAMLVQLADGVRTGDGDAAFRRGVNAVVARSDVERLGELLTLAELRHRELVGLLEPELAP